MYVIHRLIALSASLVRSLYKRNSSVENMEHGPGLRTYVVCMRGGVSVESYCREDSAC